MTIKIQCGCGTKYSFEVEPQNGLMPFRVNCPSCNADGTEAANQIIAQQPRLRMQAAPEIAEVKRAEPPVAHFPPAPPKPASGASMRKLQDEQRQMRKTLWAIAAALVIVLAVLGAYGWFVFFGSKPALAYSIQLPAGDAAWRMKLLGDGNLVIAGADRVIARDVRANKDLWQATLPGKSDSSSSDAPAPELLVNNQDIWVCNGSQVVRLDAKTGQIKGTTPLNGDFASFTPTASNILVVTAQGETRRNAVQIDLNSGVVSTRTVDVPRAEKRTTPDELPPNVAPTANVLVAQATEEGKFSKTLNAVSSEFFSAGDNLVELRVTLLEPRINWVKSIKPRGPSLINGNTTASTSVGGVEEEVFNDIKRDKTGGVKGVDESLYEVRVRRWLGDKPVEWKNNVTGLPVFFSLQSVNLLTAGKSLTVFDKQNNKLFDAQLSYAVADRFLKENPMHRPPAVERAGVLYFFDQGVLTAFSLPAGQVQWRLTSVGISRVQFDDQGLLYIDTTAAAPEEIQYSDQIKFESTPPVIMKVDPHSGKILWQVEKLGQRVYLTGKFLYTASINLGGSGMLVGLADAVHSPRPEAPTYFHIHRLDPATGKELWDFYREEAPEDEQFQQNWFLLRFGNELQAWRFLTF